MYDLIRETLFGRMVHLASRGKLFQTVEQRDPSKVLRYKMSDSVSTSGPFESTTTNAPRVEKVDPENGSDFQLVEWVEYDEEV